jgi:hypothetical protein
VNDPAARSQFYELLRRRGEPVFYAFDSLMLDGSDLRALPLLKRMRKLREAVKGHASILLARYLDDGAAFFRLVCEQDLEACRHGADWFKIRKPNCSQNERCGDLFEKLVAGRGPHNRAAPAGHQQRC